jgi:hypothetical protein
MIKIKSAWLITWEWDNDAKAVVDKVITIVNHRRSNDYIANLIEVLYDINTSNLSELGSYSKDKAFKSYKSKVDFNSVINCGANPYIVAQRVKNIEISRNSQDKEIIQWIQPPKYVMDDSKGIFIQITGEISKNYERIKNGLLSFESLWNSEENRLKNVNEIQ